MTQWAPRSVLALWGWCMACLLWLGTVPPAQAAPALVLHPGVASLNAWDVITIETDATHLRTVHDMLGSLDAFGPVARRGGSLGVHEETMWLRIPLQVQALADQHWLVNIDYYSLREVDIYLTANGQVLQEARLGYGRPRSNSALNHRTPVMLLKVQPGQSYDVLIRVRTIGPMILPITVSDMAHLMPQALGEQTLQGLLFGLALCLVLYSVFQGISQGERLFWLYALLVLGSSGFSLQFFGIGAQFLWRDNLWLQTHFGIIASFLALIGAFLFKGYALVGNDPDSRFLKLMKAAGAVTCVILVAYLMGAFSTRTSTSIISLMGPLPFLFCLPVALKRVRQGDPISATLLLAWVAYFSAAVAMVGLVQGWVPVNFWTLHSFQFGATVDMFLFLRILGLRSQAIRAEAREAARERDTMRSLAHSDPLTGLPNRRGLQLALEGALARCSPDRMVAVYLMDLNGFKPVNDTYGHDVGDELLIAVGRRLQGHVRHDTDLVARLGGDEFIVMAQDMTSTEQAQEMGLKLLQGFEEPFALQAQRVRLGLSIGYALAPLDGTNAKALIQMADSAMYSGKEQGRNRLLRYRPASGTLTSA